ncbi:hypothetical protein H4582DRAFT_1104741 [Lactarius indigo]|nr:hypothetical protein H4582DRAFT_1104741 [Lactarius indigo]
MDDDWPAIVSSTCYPTATSLLISVPPRRSCCRGLGPRRIHGSFWFGFQDHINHTSAQTPSYPGVLRAMTLLEGVATFMIRSFFSAQIIFFSICFFLCLLAWAMYAIDLGCPDLSAHAILCHACIAHRRLRVILLGYREGAGTSWLSEVRWQCRFLFPRALVQLHLSTVILETRTTARRRL